jgi:hypothetical protein
MAPAQNETLLLKEKNEFFIDEKFVVSVPTANWKFPTRIPLH